MNNKKKIILISTISFFGVLLLGAVIFGFLMVGKLPYGTVIAGEDFSFKKPDQVESLLSSKTDNYFNAKQTLKIEGKNYQLELNPEEIKPKVKETIAKQPLITNPLQTYLGFFKKKTNQPLEIEVEKEAFQKTISDLHSEDNPAPENADFYLDENNTLQISEEKVGKEMSENDLNTIIREVSLLNNLSTEFKLEEKTPGITAEKLKEQEEEINEMINRNITLEDPKYSDDWVIKLKNKPEFVSFVIDEEGEAKIEINQEALNAFIDDEVSKWLDKPVDKVIITKGEGNRAKIEGKGQNGSKVEREQLKEQLEEALLTGESKITIPVSEVAAELEIDEFYQEKGIKEVIGIGHSSYYGSPANRRHNVAVSAEKFDGLIIAPGEVFSFNQNLGNVDGTTGYKKELVIKAEGTIPEYGGGVCQTSTTMYRAALFSGLEIVDRREHSYAVSYYSQVLGHGLDATIYLGGQDFKFKNDTDNHILIHSYIDQDNEIYFVFYGTSDGRSVEMEGPFIGGHTSPGPTIYQETTTLAPGQQKQVEKSHTGFYANWKRHITKADGAVVTEDINTRYRAIPAKVLVGAGAPETTEPAAE